MRKHWATALALASVGCAAPTDPGPRFAAGCTVTWSVPFTDGTGRLELVVVYRSTAVCDSLAAAGGDVTPR